MTSPIFHLLGKDPLAFEETIKKKADDIWEDMGGVDGCGVIIAIYKATNPINPMKIRLIEVLDYQDEYYLDYNFKVGSSHYDEDDDEDDEEEDNVPMIIWCGKEWWRDYLDKERRLPPGWCSPVLIKGQIDLAFSGEEGDSSNK